jgi:hypothetical protein
VWWVVVTRVSESSKDVDGCKGVAIKYSFDVEFVPSTRADWNALEGGTASRNAGTRHRVVEARET